MPILSPATSFKLILFRLGLLLLQTKRVDGAFVPSANSKSRISTRCSTPSRCQSISKRIWRENFAFPSLLLRATSSPENALDLVELSYDSEDCKNMENCIVPASCSDGRNEDSARFEKDEDENVKLETEFKLWSKALKKAMKSLRKKQTSLESELGKAQSIESTTARAQLLVNNLYLFTSPDVTTVTVQDWENDGKDIELTLDSQYHTASAEADALFEEVRKLKRGSQVVSKLLEETSEALELLEEIELDLVACVKEEGNFHEGRFRLIQDRLKRTRSTTKFETPSLLEPTTRTQKKKTTPSGGPGRRESHIRKLTSPGGCPVWVGRNRRGNEYLSFQVARGKDVWMHARNCPGAHVVVFHRRGGTEPTNECLEFAANLAVFYSDSRNEHRAAVTLAEPKHLLKPRGAPLGAVKLRQELRTLMGRPGEVPVELKLARDESGLSDEYHLNDKAKHRRKTLEVAKHNQAKRREQNRQKQKSKRRRNKISDEDGSL